MDTVVSSKVSKEIISLLDRDANAQSTQRSSIIRQILKKYYESELQQAEQSVAA